MATERAGAGQPVNWPSLHETAHPVVTYIGGLPYTAKMLERRATRLSPKIAIVGSRDYPRLDDVWEFVATLPDTATVVSGGARGVDTAAEEAARARGLAVEIFPADWNTYGKSAGFRRNADIVNAADEVVAFIYRNSKGASHSVELARRAGKPVRVIEAA